MNTTPDRHAYRLATTDEDRITEAIRATLYLWHDNATAPLTALTSDMVAILTRIGCNAIGCTEFDMRDSELRYVAGEIDRLAAQIGAE